MLLVIPYYRGDRDLAQKLLEWIKELGDAPTLYLVRDARAESIDTLGLNVRKEIVVTESWNSWPKSPNWMISQVGRDITDEPWCWCEPDCIPMRKGWWQALEAEWEKARAADKWFVGDRVDVENVPVHMSGCALYPPNVIEHAGLMLIAHDIAFDVEAANMILPKMYETRLIEHAWRHGTFENLEQVKREIAPETVLYHSSKDGSLIDLLRMAQGREVVTHLAHNQKIEGSSPSPATASAQICDLFIKTWPADYEWLQYCLRSIEKFATGFRKVIIVSGERVPEEITLLLESLAVQTTSVGEQPDGYLWQQVIKLDADRYTDASHIVYLDSDTVFTRPVTPETFFKDGKVVWMFTPFEKLSTPWKEVTEKFLKRPVAYEHMRRHPLVIPRWLLGELRAFCEREHGVTLDAYILSQPHRAFSEWNAIGSFAHEFFKDEFIWINTEEVAPENWPVLTVKQYWSRGGVSDEIRKELEQTVAEAYNEPDGETSVVPRIGDIGGEEVQGRGGEDAPKPEETSLPTDHATHVKIHMDAVEQAAPRMLLPQGKIDWEPLPVRLSAGAAKWDRVEQLVLELKGYCDSPIATSRVRKALEGGKILPAGTINRIQKQKWRKKYRAKRKANRAS